MLKNIWTTVFLLTVVIYQKPANALDLRVQPRFKTGTQYYEFEQPEFQDIEGKFPNRQSSIKYSDWLPFVSGGTTLFIDRFFVDVDVQYLFDGQANSDFTSQNFVKGGGALPTDTVIQNNNGILHANFDRFEWAVSAGLEVFDSLVLFGGYKYAKTSTTSRIAGNIESFQASNEANIGFLTGQALGDVDIEFEYDGPFIGMNYNWRIQQGLMNGGLSFNFAAAFLDSTTQIDLSKVAVRSSTGQVVPLSLQNSDGQGGNQFTELKGDSIGYSFGLGWQGITSVKGLTYLMGVTGYHYKFEGNATVENRVRLDFGLSYAFDF